MDLAPELSEPKIYVKIQRIRLETAYKLIRGELWNELHQTMLDMIWDALQSAEDNTAAQIWRRKLSDWSDYTKGIDPDEPIPYTVATEDPEWKRCEEIDRISDTLEEVTRDRDHFMKLYHELEAKCNALQAGATVNPPAPAEPPALVKTPPVKPSVAVRQKPAPRKATTATEPKERTKPGPPERLPEDDHEGETVKLASGTTVYERKPHELLPLEVAQSIWFIHKNDREGLTMNRIGPATEAKIRELYAEELATFAGIKEFYNIGAYKQRLQAQILKEGVRRYASD
mgnify:CR=1 FL=1